MEPTGVNGLNKFNETVFFLNQIIYLFNVVSDVKFDSKAIFFYEVFSKTASEGVKIASEVLPTPPGFYGPLATPKYQYF